MRLAEVVLGADQARLLRVPEREHELAAELALRVVVRELLGDVEDAGAARAVVIDPDLLAGVAVLRVRR